MLASPLHSWPVSSCSISLRPRSSTFRWPKQEKEPFPIFEILFLVRLRMSKGEWASDKNVSFVKVRKFVKELDRLRYLRFTSPVNMLLLMIGISLSSRFRCSKHFSDWKAKSSILGNEARDVVCLEKDRFKLRYVTLESPLREWEDKCAMLLYSRKRYFRCGSQANESLSIILRLLWERSSMVRLVGFSPRKVMLLILVSWVLLRDRFWMLVRDNSKQSFSVRLGPSWALFRLRPNNCPIAWKHLGEN